MVIYCVVIEIGGVVDELVCKWCVGIIECVGEWFVLMNVLCFFCLIGFRLFDGMVIEIFVLYDVFLCFLN